jgi:hypothetical protein
MFAPPYLIDLTYIDENKVTLLDLVTCEIGMSIDMVKFMFLACFWSCRKRKKIVKKFQYITNKTQVLFLSHMRRVFFLSTYFLQCLCMVVILDTNFLDIFMLDISSHALPSFFHICRKN